MEIHSCQSGVTRGIVPLCLISLFWNGSLRASDFGSGYLLGTIGANDENIRSIVFQSDGRIVAGGNYELAGSNNDFEVMRFHPDGSLDSGFGSAGIATIDFSSSTWDYLNGIHVDKQGKVVATGKTVVNTDTHEVAIARLETNGILDTTFATDGTWAIAFASHQGAIGRGVVVDEQERILIAGMIDSDNTASSQNLDFLVMRTNSGGNGMDTNWGSGGFVTTEITGSRHDAAHAILYYSDDRVVVAGGTNAAASNNDFAVVRYDTDGSLDATCDTDGKQTTDISSGGDDLAWSMTFDSTNRLVVGGRSWTATNFDFAVARYHTNCVLDTTFATDGSVITDIIPATNDIARGVAVQNDETIIAGGRSFSGSNWDFAITRYNSDGALISNFGSKGIVLTALNSDEDDSGFAVSVLGATPILGGSVGNGSNTDFTIARFGAHGELEPSGDLYLGWASDGQSVGVQFFSNDTNVFELALDGDGKILAAGMGSHDGSTASEEWGLLRYHSDGTLDTHFGSQGYWHYDFSSNQDRLYAVTYMSTGNKIIVGGLANLSDFPIARLNSDGSFDSDFGSSGIITTSFYSKGDTSVRSLILKDDNQLIGAGYTGPSSNSEDFAMVRVNTDGSLDTNFGSSGTATSNFSSDEDFAYAAKTDSNGNILLGGFLELTPGDNNSRLFALARYNTDGFLDTNFGSSGLATSDFSSVTDYIQDIAIRPDNKIIAWGQTNNGAALGQLVRYNTDGSLDTEFASNGGVLLNFQSNVDNPFGCKLGPSGKIVVGFRGGMARLTSEGVLDPTFASSGVRVTNGMGSTRGDILHLPEGPILGVGDSGGNNTVYVLSVHP